MKGVLLSQVKFTFLAVLLIIVSCTDNLYYLLGEFSISGTVNGLVGTALVLQNNDGDDLSITAGGAFQFSTKLKSNDSYNVTIKTQPSSPSQACTVTNGVGEVTNSNIENISITCPVITYAIGGTVSGLVGTGLVLQINGTNDIAVIAGTPFTFPTQLEETSTLNITIKDVPTGEYCYLTTPTTTITNTAITDISVTCSSATVSPLYPTNGSKWNDYVNSDGSNIFNASDVVCPGTGNGYNSCIHGGEMRSFKLTGLTSCTGITATDSLGAFTWVCNDSVSPLIVSSVGLKEGKALSSLIDFTSAVWLDNSLTISTTSGIIMRSNLAKWFVNPVVVRNTGISLAASGTIYIITSNPGGNYIFGANNIGFVVKPDLIMFGGGGGDILYASTKNFLWIEGIINATGNTNGLSWSTVGHSVLHNFSVFNVSSTGALITGSDSNYFKNLNFSNNGYHGMFNNGGSRYNLYENITVSNNASFGYCLLNSSKAVSNNITAMASGKNLNVGTTNSIWQNVTSTLTTGRGIYLTDGITTKTIFTNVAAINNATGIYADSSNFTFSVLNNIIATGNDTGISLNSDSYNVFTGILKVGNNGTNCSITTAGTNPGLVDTTCANAGKSSAILTTGVTVANSFIGKIGTAGVYDTTQDSINLDDDATPGLVAFTSITNWAEFENSQRVFATNGSTFPNTNNRGRCTSGSCRIWDWSLSNTETGVLRNVNTLPNGNDVFYLNWGETNSTNCNKTKGANWQANICSYPGYTDQAACDAAVGSADWATSKCITTLLKNTTEILKDGIGNDNGLCESNETCLFSPNIGSYQGHGNLISAGTFADGIITNVTLLKYDINGQ